jgi:hypothetical protein
VNEPGLDERPQSALRNVKLPDSFNTDQKHQSPVNRHVPNVLAFANLGPGSNEEYRIRELLGRFNPEVVPFDRACKFRMFWRLLRVIRRVRPDLVVMEGTGISGGAALIVSRLLFGQHFVVSSGDAVGPWVGSRSRLLAPIFGLYERLLCRFAKGYIGWTPYLAGRALTFGCKQAITAAGWAPFVRSPEEQSADRARTRQLLDIPHDHLVVGIAGTMHWSNRHSYCYGRELIDAARLTSRETVTYLLVGDGNGRERLERLASGLPSRRVVFAGRVPQEELPAFYAAMDVGSLPQSVDGVGSFRYTTKLSEYLAFGIPIVTGQIPMAYDLDSGWLWRLPGRAPWDRRYVAALAGLIDRLSPEELTSKRSSVPVSMPEFDLKAQVARVEAFVNDLVKG